MSTDDRLNELSGFVEANYRDHSSQLVALQGAVRDLGDDRDFKTLDSEVASLRSQFHALKRELFAEMREEFAKLHAAETHAVQVAINPAVAAEIAKEIGKTIIVTRQANTSEIHNGAPAVKK